MNTEQSITNQTVDDMELSKEALFKIEEFYSEISLNLERALCLMGEIACDYFAEPIKPRKKFSEQITIMYPSFSIKSHIVLDYLTRVNTAAGYMGAFVEAGFDTLKNKGERE